MRLDHKAARTTAQALSCAMQDVLWEQRPAGPTEADCTLLDALVAWSLAEHGEETPGGIESLAGIALRAMQETHGRVIYVEGDGIEKPTLTVSVRGDA